MLAARVPEPARRVSLADIKGDGVTTTHSAQESAANIDALADEFRDRIGAAQDVDNAKAVRVDIEAAKTTLASALFTELKNTAVRRYSLVDARNKVEAAINSLPQSDDRMLQSVHQSRAGTGCCEAPSGRRAV